MAEASESIARAGLVLACAIFALAVPGSESGFAPCAAPREAAARHGRTEAVRCDGRGPRLRGAARRLFGLPIDPNTADALTLTTLPGIGPVRAQAIIAARQRRPFRSVADVERARGVGPRTLERLAPHLAVAHTRGDPAVPADRRHAVGEGGG
jgi:competence protein ComEA